jgi:hypothetical protein
LPGTGHLASVLSAKLRERHQTSTELPLKLKAQFSSSTASSFSSSSCPCMFWSPPNQHDLQRSSLHGQFFTASNAPSLIGRQSTHKSKKNDNNKNNKTERCKNKKAFNATMKNSEKEKKSDSFSEGKTTASVLDP